jgi:hypothetical protein
MRAIAILLFCCSTCFAEEISISQPDAKGSETVEEAITIPLTEIWSTNQQRIWAVDEPLTRYIGELEANTPGNRSLASEIKKSLGFGKAGPAFVVQGTGIESLKNAHEVIVGNQSRSNNIPHGSDSTIVFYAHGSPYYVSITKVKRQGKLISIAYELIPKLENNEPKYLALISLGKLPSGHYQVEINHEPYEKRFVKYGKSGPNKLVLGRVSTSFEFNVE